MTKTQNCYTSDMLLAFLRGKLDDHEESELQSHVNECNTCRVRLDSSVADAEGWNEAKRFLGLEYSPNVLDDAGDAFETTRLSLQVRQVLESLDPTDDPEML
jgi:anti-sigma factor RsiW